jgi:hypothetical protein
MKFDRNAARWALPALGVKWGTGTTLHPSIGLSHRTDSLGSAPIHASADRLQIGYDLRMYLLHALGLAPQLIRAGLLRDRPGSRLAKGLVNQASGR